MAERNKSAEIGSMLNFAGLAVFSPIGNIQSSNHKVRLFWGVVLVGRAVSE